MVTVFDLEALKSRTLVSGIMLFIFEQSVHFAVT